MSVRRIEIYDTTLRDGTQGEGFSLSLQDKLLIARRLDDLGVDIIEGGFPVSNPKDVAFFDEVKRINFKHARVAAFGMTRRRGVKAEEDPGCRALLEAETPVVTIVGKTSPFQIREILNITTADNLAMISETVGLMAREGRECVYDAEHFFDTFKEEPAYAIETLKAAADNGARTVCLCDTNGGSLPNLVAEATRAARAALPQGVAVGIHTHNDSSLALANALAAIEAGAAQAQGTINGVGERCGNMDLLALVATLRLKLGMDCLKPESLKRLTETSRFVYELANLQPPNGQPYVGESAFAHKGGMHVHAVRKHTSAYEHVDPESIGNSRKILVSELSGASNIAEKAGRKFDIENDKETLRTVLQRVQELENEGFHFESAEASFELLLRKQINRHRRFFALDHYRVVILRQNENDAVAEATVKLHIDDHLEHRVAEGRGPVNALYAALVKALRRKYPAIDDLHLADYKVRVINSAAETAAKVRVITQCRRHKADGSVELFGTIGVNENIIDASWLSLVDAIEYHLIHVEEES